MGRDPHIAAAFSVTESHVRISAHVHNAISIIFVHQISLNPKRFLFGHIYTDQVPGA